MLYTKILINKFQVKYYSTAGYRRQLTDAHILYNRQNGLSCEFYHTVELAFSDTLVSVIQLIGFCST